MTASAVQVPDGVDAGAPWHYGDPLREQRALATRAGVVDRSHRDVLTVTGPDRLGWLHSICSQHVADLADGESVEALVLSPHGHVEQHWQLSELAATVWLDTEPGAAEAVLDYLQKMRFLKRVELADVTDQYGILSVVGPRSAEVLAAAGVPAPDPGRAQAIDGGFVRRMSWPGADAADILVASPQLAATRERLTGAGAEPAGIWAFEALRLEARRPRLGLETDHRAIPHEVGWIGTAVHLQKGCYRGQETVARVQNLGRPPRRLVLLHLSGESDTLPGAGSAVELDGRAVGFIGTAVQHWELGPVALAVIKRTVPDGATVRVAAAVASVDG
jgi:folate-binding protein YgfZ